jgi:hypothetical protein
VGSRLLRLLDVNFENSRALVRHPRYCLFEGNPKLNPNKHGCSETTGPLPGDMPHPTYAPVLTAAGVLCILWGAVTGWELTAVGLGLALLGAVKWIRGAGL